MILFAFDITFRSGRFLTLFFHDTDIAAATLRAPGKAAEQYGSEAADIIDITVTARFS